jgi:hypothetical protein
MIKSVNASNSTIEFKMVKADPKAVGFGNQGKIYNKV